MTEENKKRIPLWLYPSTLESVDRWQQQDNCKSRSEFIEKAVRFTAEKFLRATLRDIC
jgi:metal-responsive CopG/Arc/MetJ family transcriptional regulator